ncbi:hypothetical protein PHYPSEUDO_012722 [Phytophthora pseudosyringae]|uniref:Protein kinase domain-containing protein n=1 Tax=Phytophthora pseudosyringae TaxID=221518 RepID=A0A8T1W812_9STRA|nr:hypothetical protein PHYPSEUDO_012722 [Phytophthora pseudosyringae]
MSVAPRAAPSMSGRSKVLSRRESTWEEEELAVGSVVVMLSGRTDDQSAAAYRSPTGDSGQDDAKPISSTASTQKDQSFMAVLAPSCDAAMAALQSQPPGTFLLVKEEDAAITVYVKFRQAVRALTLVKGKEIKKNDDAIQLAKLRKKELDGLMQAPVHNLHLASESYFLVEHCWKRFLPQVQAVVFELCCEPHLDEGTKLEDWTPSMVPSSSVYSVGLMPEACGFYILAAPHPGTDSVLHVRQVEFDFNKFAITVADGTHKPSALLLATSFSAKRTFEPDFAFNAIRDNFLTPDLVMLKETSVNSLPSQQSSLQSCIDLSCNDRELAVLSAADAACGSVLPHEALPDSFLTALHEMHVYFVNTTIRDGTSLSSKPAPWSAQKVKLAGRIVPILVELLIASAAFAETATSTDQMDVHSVAVESSKRQALAQFSHSMRFDILFMTARSDDAVICRLTHQLCQLLGARIRLPSELVDIIRDLVALFPVFQRLFLRNQGTASLWRNVHHSDPLDEDAAESSTPDVRGKSGFRSFRALPLSTTAVNALQGKSSRKLSVFGLGRKPQTKSRKSMSLGAKLTPSPFLNSKALAFFRLSLLSAQMYLGMHVREGFFTFPDVWKEDPVLAKIAFCSCNGAQFGEPKVPTDPAPVCARTRLRSSPKMITYELLLQLSLRFLYLRSSFGSWDRDVALLLRLEEVQRHLFDEIISIVRRRNEAQNINTREALSCELRVTIACVSTLFRLERKRRKEVSLATGDKKYLAIIYFFRTKLRELNERLKVQASCDDHAHDDDAHFLNALAQVFQWIPKAFLDEWVVLSLKELLQTVSGLSVVVKQTAMPLPKQLQFVGHSCELFKVFAVILRRTSDPDMQTMLVRVLGLESAAIIALLRFVLLQHSLSVDAVRIHVHVLNFLSAFVNLDVALSVQNDWKSNTRTPGADEEDAEVIEQLKGELLIRLLGPRITMEDAEQNDQTLWDFMLELMFPSFGADTVASFNAKSRMIDMAVSFRSVSAPPVLLTSISRGHFQVKEAFLLLQQALYTTQDASSPIDYEHCVASHWRRIEQYSDRVIANAGREEPSMVYRMVELHFRCLLVLASRRSQFPAIHAAFNHTRVLLSLVQRLKPQVSSPISSQSQRESSDSRSSDEVRSAVPSLPPLKLPRQPSTDTSEVPGIAQLSFSTPHSLSSVGGEVHIEQNFLLLEPGLHALAIVLVATYVIADPNLEIDEAVCPRISVPDQVDADSNVPKELLWKLQQHLATVEMDARYFEPLMVEMETLQAFTSTARVSAVRSLVRLLCPNRFDCNLYAAQGDSETQHAREYVAKGAFSTVYRQHPALPRPDSVAVKVVEHQRRAGELCALSGVFNEVSILAKLRGNLAATQLVDFGNHYAERSFEIVMEYCPCSLTEWRASIDSEVPFRSCLVMILRALEEACQCLARIHQAGVCHFDIKSDNVLVRSSARELSCRLLENEREAPPASDLKGWLCLADFGESKVVDADRIPVRTSTFSSFSSGAASPQKQADKFVSLTRTRGTEAIKSPEVLQIKGGDVAQAKVTLASDTWSLGCLLYELVTQELVFQNDDWAGLYAHLVVTKDQPVLRSDHRHKMVVALSPACSEEEAIVTRVFELCSHILAREPTLRPKLGTIIAHVRRLVNDVHELPVTASDEAFVCHLKGGTSPPEAPCPVPVLGPFPTAPSCRKHGVVVPARLFWNFFLAGAVEATGTVTSCVGGSSAPTGKDVLAMDAFEAKHEADFVHFVYVSWLEPGEPGTHGLSRGFIEELHEEEHRTCFLLTPRAGLPLFQQLEQHAARYFPVLQRRLRDEAGGVAFVALGGDVDATRELQQVVTGMLLFFLRWALAMPAFDVLSRFARDCAQFFAYPTPAFVQHLVAYVTAPVEDTETSTMVRCRCGASVLTVEAAAFTEALAGPRCTCKRGETDAECPCFHPFPSDDDLDDQVDAACVHDNSEEQLVLPLETRAKRGDAVRWVCVDAASVGSVSSETGSLETESDRPMSRFDPRKRRVAAGEGSSPRQEAAATDLQELLVRGLQRRGKPSNASSSDAWELYECELCRLPICALSDDQLQVAVPVLRSND